MAALSFVSTIRVIEEASSVGIGISIMSESLNRLQEVNNNMPTYLYLLGVSHNFCVENRKQKPELVIVRL